MIDGELALRKRPAPGEEEEEAEGRWVFNPKVLLEQWAMQVDPRWLTNGAKSGLAERLNHLARLGVTDDSFFDDLPVVGDWGAFNRKIKLLSAETKVPTAPGESGSCGNGDCTKKGHSRCSQCLQVAYCGKT